MSTSKKVATIERRVRVRDCCGEQALNNCQKSAWRVVSCCLTDDSFQVPAPLSSLPHISDQSKPRPTSLPQRPDAQLRGGACLPSVIGLQCYQNNRTWDKSLWWLRVKGLAIKPNDLSLTPGSWDLYGRRRDRTPGELLTSACKLISPPLHNNQLNVNNFFKKGNKNNFVQTEPPTVCDNKESNDSQRMGWWIVKRTEFW